ncbi:hypothetical protein F5Y19DRAFT_66179 [Xylariaceae sp. FL1651]|nr:hypothetical protein F5Y19DRAFT_66179 [Xylariaceae sp. FL1651]
MPSDFVNKAARRAKALGLTINTSLASNDNVDGSNHIATASLLKHVDSLGKKDEVPKLSEALLNTDWRNNRRRRGDSTEKYPPLLTAPPEKLAFSREEIKVKPQRSNEHDNGYGLRRYRESPIDHEFIFSAPATKKEFFEAQEEAEPQPAGIIIETEFAEQRMKRSSGIGNLKPIVRLNEMTPTTRGGFEKILYWDQQHGSPNTSQRGSLLHGSSSITAVSPADLSATSYDKVEFPLAEICAVKGAKRFLPGLSGVEATIRKQLAKLVEPRSAGLPIDYIREDYEEGQKALHRAAEFDLDGHNDGAETDDKGSDTDGSKQARFNALLGKLQKSAAQRIRSYTVNDKDDSQDPSASEGSENVANGHIQRSSSRDSAISGFSFRGRKRSSTLNPEASEFRITSQTHQPAVLNDCVSVIPSHPVPTNQVENSQAPATTDSIRLLETRVAELEAQLATQRSSGAPAVAQNSTIGWNINSAPYRHMPHGPAVIGGGAYSPAMNGQAQGPAGYQNSQPIPAQQAQPGFAARAARQPMNMMPPMPNSGFVHNSAELPLNPISAGFVGGQINPSQLAFPSGLPAAPQPGYPQSGFHGAGFQAVAGLPATGPPQGSQVWVKNTFGPKPVPKPKGPSRPGGPTQAQRQQEYEEYLEYLRTTDPTYALKCKQRQARRAARVSASDYL